MFEKLGKFEIQRVLGNGAMGEVYLGVDPSIGREVAIKTILPSAAQGAEAKERFSREARAAGVLNHPNLVTIYEFGEDQGVLYIAMEFVKGHDLDELLHQQALGRGEALEVLAQVCDGLAFAHRQQIVHRDIKPANVRVQRDGRRLHAKVMDFGVAKISNSDMTATGMVMGTVSYMAPEYIRTGKPDPRSDLFAVGVMLYECLSGRKPFAGDTTPTVLYKIVNEPPDPIDTELLQGISPAIRSVLDRALAKDPDERFQTAEDLAKALRAARDPSWAGQVEDATALIRASAPTAPTAPGALPPLASSPRPPAPAPRRTSLWLGSAALAMVALGGSWWAWGRKTTPSAPAPAPLPQASPASEPPVPAAAALPVPSPRTDPPKAESPAPAPKKSAPVRAEEPRTIDQPKRYEDEQLDKLQVHERLNLANVSLSEAIQLADSQPERAIQGFRQALRADPGNVNARAWLAVVLYDQGRTAEFTQELREARRLGVLGSMAARNLRFRSVLTQARFNRKLPSDLAE
ncbi:serine/threonine-protein kinase [Geothrix sp. 21YS21S-4]|uniref:serine/threonine-protein kinase n=1 Tax=Geothrix sp. 21YS21S-4 TaxID=3068889 RepID=UPI0027BA58F6|nr:serine/threonine-protein kinase [Geothrix sp. 21YS21S-4]